MNKKAIFTSFIFLGFSLSCLIGNFAYGDTPTTMPMNPPVKVIPKPADTKSAPTKIVKPAAKPVSKTSQNASQKTPQNAQKPMAQTKPINTTSLNIVANPAKYLNKTVKMQATFDKFSTLGLDYNKALRKSTDYIGILIQRDDVVDHNIPLSEMKLFLKKELAEKHIDLDTGDKIEITAKVFSTALNDPWLDVLDLTVIKKAKHETKE